MMESVSRTASRSNIPVPVHKGRSNHRPRKPLSTLQLKNTPSHLTLASKTARESSVRHPSHATCMSTPRPNPAHATPRPDPPHTTHPLHGTPRPDQSHFTPRPGPPHVTPTTRPRARKENLFEKWVQSTIKSSHRRVTQQPATSIITVNIATATPVTVNTVAATPNTVAATPNTVAATPVVDTVKLNLEAQLNDASDCPTSHTNKHIPTSTTNFYEIEEELLKLQWHRVCIEDGESQGRCDPLATLLNQHYFVPVSQSSVEQNFL